ncbi:MAG TPA: helix-turn-helix transcriptional regulator [Solirubrobacterales bacterium]|nr:helix-turn-helix transcriptional regulator [Solirubrobacterales bacterium]
MKDAVAALSGLSLDPAELLREADQRIQTVVPCESSRWWTVDPETMLATDLGESGPRAREEEVFSGEDFDAFDRLDREGRESLVEGSVLRLASRSGGATWVAARLRREPDRPALTEAEVEYLTGLGGYVAAGVRSYLADAPRLPGHSVVPGVLTVGSDDHIRDATPEAMGWLARWGVAAGDPLPQALRGLVRQTREQRVGPAPLRAAKVRIRLPEGHWVVARADRFAVEEDHTAILMKAATRADLRSLYFSVHGLTQRERELTELLIEGADLQDVASTLNLSIHTVRTHVKAIFAKVDVRSRAELTAAFG